MSDELISCPLCCNKQFSNKQSLVTHLGDVISSLSCSICSKKFTSLEQLIEHLNHDNCQSSKINHRYTFHFCDEINDFISEEKDQLNENSEESHTVPNEKPDEAENILIETSCSQMEFPTEDLKFVQDIGNGQYMVLTSHDDIDKSGETILTKQNSDGTISLTNIKDTDSVITITQSIKKEEEVNEDELYSCNTCGVTFTSVIEHIQKYHNDQDVVVEEHVELTLDQELQELRKKEKELDDKRQSRRVITDTGDIVEDPLFVTYTPTNETIEQVQPLNNKPLLQLRKDEVREKQTKSKKYVQIDKFCDSVVKDIKKNDDKNGPYHRVIVKEIQTLEDGQTKAKLYTCMSCSVTVTSLDQFKLHPCKTLKYNCPHCSVAYDNSKSLCAHMKVHKVTPSVTINNPNSSIIKYDSDIIGQFKCEICSTLFQTNKSLKLHKRMHDPLKARHIEPPVGTADSDGASEEKFLCSVCDKLIPIGYRKVHQNSHKHNNKFNCDICNKKFTSTEYLQMHINVHNSEKSRVYKGDKALPYSCAFCPRQFSRPHEKVKHERIHTGEKPHSCAICGKSFRVAYCLTLHMRTHTGARPYECPHCSKRFKAHSVYNHHLLTHSEVRAYKCPYCPKAFKTSVQLAGHKNSHTKPFSCQHCNRPFASLYAVRVHTETHLRQNNLKFSCSWCGASYARTFALKDHIKQVHVKEYEESQDVQETQATELITELGINSNEADAVMIDQ